jgi:hypothetical protein
MDGQSKMKPTYETHFTTHYSRHAAVRMQQRSIPDAAVELLLDFALPTPVGGGSLSYRFTADTWADAQTALGSRAPAFVKYRNAYVIESADGVVITAAWLH